MDPEQLKQAQARLQAISGMLASGKVDQIKEAQRQLQALGFNVNPDGRLGSATSTAVGQLRQSIETAAGLQVRETEAAGKIAENDPTNRAMRFATEFGPWALGAGLGVGTSLYAGSKFSKQDKAQREAAGRLAASGAAGDVSPQAAQSGLRKMDTERRWRAGKQFLGPAAWLGAGAFTSEVVAPRFADDPETQKYINLAATTENAAGTSMAAKQLIDLALRGDPIDPVDRARIGSLAPPSPSSGPPPVTPPAVPLGQQPQTLTSSNPSAHAPSAPPAPQQLPNAERLRTASEAATGKKAPKAKKEAHYNMMKRALTAENQAAVAEALGLPGTASRKTVLQHARDIMKLGGRSAIFLPAAVGSYMASTGESEAADATMGERVGNTATDFAIGAGGAAAGMKGMEALSRFAPTTMKALGSGMTMATPGAVADMTDEFASPEARNAAARYLPEFLQFGAVGEARDLAQVPTANPERRGMGPRLPEGADQDVARAWRSSPRRTVIELSRTSGLDAADIAMLAGVSPQEVASVMGEIPSRALNRTPVALAAR